MIAVAFDSGWWLEQTVIWLVYSVTFGAIVWVVGTVRERRGRRPYEGWLLVTNGFTPPDPPQLLYWEDVERYLRSDRELWVLVKGTLSGTYDVMLRTIHSARDVGWVVVDRPQRKIVIDATKIPPEHAAKRSRPSTA